MPSLKRSAPTDDNSGDNGDESPRSPAPKRGKIQVDRVSDLFAMPADADAYVTVVVEEPNRHESFQIPIDLLVKNSPVFSAMLLGMLILIEKE